MLLQTDLRLRRAENHPFSSAHEYRRSDTNSLASILKPDKACAGTESLSTRYCKDAVQIILNQNMPEYPIPDFQIQTSIQRATPISTPYNKASSLAQIDSRDRQAQAASPQHDWLRKEVIGPPINTNAKAQSPMSSSSLQLRVLNTKT